TAPRSTSRSGAATSEARRPARVGPRSSCPAGSTVSCACPTRRLAPRRPSRTPSRPSPTASNGSEQMSEYSSVDGLGAELGDDAVLRLTIDRPNRKGSIDDAMGQAPIGHLVTAGQDEGVQI